MNSMMLTMTKIEKTIYRTDNVSYVVELDKFRMHLIAEFEKQKAYKQVDARTSRLVKLRERASAKAETYGYVVECLKAIDFTTEEEKEPVKICPQTFIECNERCSGKNCHIQLRMRLIRLLISNA